MNIEFSNILLKQKVEDWGDDKGFSAIDRLWDNLVERFGVQTVRVVGVIEEQNCMILRLTSDKWTDEREFAILADGRLAW